MMMTPTWLQGNEKSLHREYPVQRQRLWQQKPSYLTLTALEEASRIDSTAETDKTSRIFNRGLSRFVCLIVDQFHVNSKT